MTDHTLNAVIEKYKVVNKKLRSDIEQIKDFRFTLSVSKDPEDIFSTTRDEMNPKISEILETFEQFETHRRSSSSPNQSFESLDRQVSLEFGRLHLMWGKIIFSSWEINQLVPSGSVSLPGIATFLIGHLPDLTASAKSRSSVMYYTGANTEQLFRSLYHFNRAHQYLVQNDRSFLSPVDFLKNTKSNTITSSEDHQLRTKLIRKTLKHWGHGQVAFARCLIYIQNSSHISSTVFNHVSYFEAKSLPAFVSTNSDLSPDSALKLANVFLKEGGDLLLISWELFQEEAHYKDGTSKFRTSVDILRKLAEALHWKGVVLGIAAPQDLLTSQLDFATSSLFYLKAWKQLQNAGEKAETHAGLMQDWGEIITIFNPAYDFNNTVVPFLNFYSRLLVDLRPNDTEKTFPLDPLKHLLSAKFGRQRDQFSKVASPILTPLAKDDDQIQEILHPKTPTVDITTWFQKPELKIIHETKTDLSEFVLNIPILLRAMNYFQKHLERKKGGSTWKVIKSTSDKKGNSPSSPASPAPASPSPPLNNSGQNASASSSTGSLSVSQAEIDELFTAANPKKLVKDKKKIGQGAFSRVFSVTFKEKTVAMKVLNKEFRSYEETICNEVRAMKLLVHENILNLVEAFLWKGKVTIFMEYLNLGALTDTPGKIKWGPENIRWVARETIKGLAYLHNSGVIHCDLKTDNILLSTEPSLKIGDLGLLRRAPRLESKVVGTLGYMAPELFTRSLRTAKLDIYSLGCIVNELCVPGNPFRDVHPIKIIFQTCTTTIPRLSKWEESIANFVEKCVHHEPEARPDAESLLTDPFISQNIDLKEIARLFTLFTSAVYSMYG